jgi:type II secretory pathway component PulJ
MNLTKKSDSKLEKKKAKLRKLLSTKNQIERKIKLLKADIEVLQTQQFEKLKKAAKKENLEIRSDDIPEILQLIKNLQQNSKVDRDEVEEEPFENELEQNYSEKVAEENTTTYNGMRTLQSLQSINSFSR